MSTNLISAIAYDKTGFSGENLIGLYTELLKPRLIEEKMLKLLRQGKITKWFSGIGQEAISVGVTQALYKEEYIFTLHRNLGVFTSRNIPLSKLFAQWQGKKSGFTKGRDRSFHFGAMDFHIVGMISHLGPQLSLADGVGLAHKLNRDRKIAVAFTGEGATSEGEFHEALNLAAVWELPVLFVIENNGYGLSTTPDEQYRCKTLADKGIGYGMEAKVIDGNNILEVVKTVQEIAASMREHPRPFLLECMTFRRRGHEEASGTKYVPQALMDYWEERDPLDNYEKFLLEEGILSSEEAQEIRLKIQANIDQELKMADEEAELEADLETEIQDVYAPYVFHPHLPGENLKEKRFIDAISDGLDQAMQKFDRLILMGQDIAGYGGVFKITEGFLERYGSERVRNTPLCESAVIGAGLGLGLLGYKSMVEMQFADFVSVGFNQIVNNLAKLHYRWGQNADVVIRMPCGGGVGAGPFHSQCNEAWFAHTPGLKVVFPSSPYDAKGLLLASFEDPNPVMFFEHKALYRRISEQVPEGYYNIEIGKAKIVKSGTKATVITYGMGVHWATQVVNDQELDVEIIDLRTLLPVDYATIETSVRKTGKVIILHEDTLFGGLGGEISAYISEHLFESLDGPIIRVAGLDTPIPFSPVLEKQFLPLERFQKQLTKLLSY